MFDNVKNSRAILGKRFKGNGKGLIIILSVKKGETSARLIVYKCINVRRELLYVSFFCYGKTIKLIIYFHILTPLFSKKSLYIALYLSLSAR